MDLTSIGSFLIFALVLSILVFVHEFGHFITAKRLGIHIEEFGFGFPPRLIGVVRDANGKLRLVKGQTRPSRKNWAASARSIRSTPFRSAALCARSAKTIR